MSRKKKHNYSSPCCGSKISSQNVPPRSYHICQHRGWEDCPVQFKDHNYEGPANSVSLNQAKKNLAKFGVGVLSWGNNVENPKEQSLDELLAKVTAENLHGEIDTGS